MEIDEDLHGNRDLFDMLQEEASFEDEHVHHLRGQHRQAWSLAPGEMKAFIIQHFWKSRKTNSFKFLFLSENKTIISCK